jgi:hypothetical protein
MDGEAQFRLCAFSPLKSSPESFSQSRTNFSIGKPGPEKHGNFAPRDHALVIRVKEIPSGN